MKRYGRISLKDIILQKLCRIIHGLINIVQYRPKYVLYPYQNEPMVLNTIRYHSMVFQ